MFYSITRLACWQWVLYNMFKVIQNRIELFEQYSRLYGFRLIPMKNHVVQAGFIDNRGFLLTAKGVNWADPLFIKPPCSYFMICAIGRNGVVWVR